MTAFPYDAVVFDLDGTLADTAPDLTASLAHTLQRFGRSALSRPTVRGMVGGGVRLLVRRAFEATGGASEPTIDAAHDVFMDHYRSHLCIETRPYPGAGPALEALRRSGTALALCTNKPEALAAALVDALGWSGRFTAIIGGDTLPVRKPDPAPLSEAVRRAGAAKAVLVGDSPIDAETARAAGVPFVAVSFGYSDRPVETLGAAAVIDDLAELTSVLTRI